MRILLLSPARRWLVLLALTGLLTACAFAQSDDNGALPDDPSSAFSQSANTPSAPAAAPSRSRLRRRAMRRTAASKASRPNASSASSRISVPCPWMRSSRRNRPKDKFKESHTGCFRLLGFYFLSRCSRAWGRLRTRIPSSIREMVGYGRYYWHALVGPGGRRLSDRIHRPRCSSIRILGITRWAVEDFPNDSYTRSAALLITRTDMGNETINARKSSEPEPPQASPISTIPPPNARGPRRASVGCSTWASTARPTPSRNSGPTLNNKFFHQKN